jgi:hypothetical protein
MERAWLLEDLKPWPVARKALGLVLSQPRESPLKWYDNLYRRKVLGLLENALKNREDWLEEVETYLLAGARLEAMLPAKPKAQDILDALEAVNGWQSPRLALSLCLQKRGPLQAVKESLGLLEEHRSPVSDQEFLKELKELTFAEYLELVTSSS